MVACCNISGKQFESHSISTPYSIIGIITVAFKQVQKCVCNISWLQVPYNVCQFKGVLQFQQTKIFLWKLYHFVYTDSLHSILSACNHSRSDLSWYRSTQCSCQSCVFTTSQDQGRFCLLEVKQWRFLNWMTASGGLKNRAELIQKIYWLTA